MFFQQDDKIPVVVALTGGLGGITSWAFRLREVFNNNPTYKVLLMQCATSQPSPAYDLFAPTLKMAYENIKQFYRVVVIPNFSFELIQMCIELNQSGSEIRCIGIAHSDSDIEYYNPLEWYEPQIDQFITVSTKCDRELKRRIPHRKSDITKVIYPVRVLDSLPSLTQEQPIKLVYAGRVIQEQKRVLDLIELVTFLTARNVKFTLDIIGDGPELWKMKNELSEYVAKGVVCLPGLVDPGKMEHLWSGYDVFIQMSEYEGTSISMLEAMANGVVPIVTSVSGTMEDVLRPGINGFVFPVTQIEMAAHWIELLSNNTELRNKMRYACNEAAQDFSLSTYVQKIEPVFERALGLPQRYWPRNRNPMPELPYREQASNWNNEGKKWINRQKLARATAFVLPAGYSLGGTTTWSLQMCLELQKRGRKSFIIEHEPDVVYYKPIETDSKYQVSNLKCAGKPAFHYDGNDLNLYVPVYGSIAPATVVPNWAAGTYATCAQLIRSNANCLRVIGYAHSDEPYYYELLRYYEPIISKFIAVSEEVCSHLLQYIPHRQPDIIVKPYAVNVLPSSEKCQLKSHEPLKITYAGRLVQHQKRVLDLVPLVEQLDRQGVNFTLKIAGDGPESELLQEKMRSLNSTKVIFRGPVPPDKMQNIWHESDICLLVSDFEGTSISMLEAMGYGVVPVVTQVSGTSKVIKHNINGLLAPIGDTEQIAQNIAALDADRSLLNLMSNAAHQTILQRYSYSDYVTWFLDLDDEIWQMPARKWPHSRSINQYF